VGLRHLPHTVSLELLDPEPNRGSIFLLIRLPVCHWASVRVRGGGAAAAGGGESSYSRKTRAFRSILPKMASPARSSKSALALDKIAERKGKDLSDAQTPSMRSAAVSRTTEEDTAKDVLKRKLAFEEVLPFISIYYAHRSCKYEMFLRLVVFDPCLFKPIFRERTPTSKILYQKSKFNSVFR
jgi:hypothetical protein